MDVAVFFSEKEKGNLFF